MRFVKGEEKMAVTCPRCVSENVKRSESWGDLGRNSIFTGISILVLSYFLGGLFIVKKLVMFFIGIGLLFCIFSILGKIFRRKKVKKWNWECEACKHQFTTLEMQEVQAE